MKRAVAAVAAVAAFAAAPATAQTPACPVANPTYTGNCGPTFVLPGWGDAGGWTDPSQYSTIQLADVDGDGRDELLGRSDAGIQVHVFDTTLGQWRPQVDAQNLPIVLSDFSTNLPSEGPIWTEPQYYTTIQAADVDGQPGAEILARFPRGMRVYRYSSGANAGWAPIATRGPFSDADGWGADPSLYSTIGTADLNGDKVDELISRTPNGIVAYRFNGASWTQLRTLTDLGTNGQSGQQPEFYSDIVSGDVDGKGSDEVLSRTEQGVYTARLAGGDWAVLDNLSSGFSVFGDDVDPEAPDCPFVRGRTQDCFGSSPSYYDTMQLADVDGKPGLELLGRATDGLRVHPWGGSGAGWTGSLPTLTALAGPGTMQAGRYTSIGTANLDGTGGAEVLALDGTELEAWSLTGGRWTELSPSTPLALGGDPWLKDPSTFSTIGAGDVDGDGRDEVIARGPYGVRTWFYNRRGTGGWERYLADGYPSFTGRQGLAYQELNDKAHADGFLQAQFPTVRDLWDGENAPAQSALNALQQGILGTITSCSGPSSTLPITYASCSPPIGSTGFNTDDWTSVVNEVLREIFWAGQVLQHFTTVGNLNNLIFIGSDAQFPAIGADLDLEAAAAVQASYDLQQEFQAMLDIIGAIAGEVADPEAEAALTVTGEIMAMVPSGTASLNETFNATYAQVSQQFANWVSDAQDTVIEHSQDVRQDFGLNALVGQLVQRGTWDIDTGGATTAGRWGFALWAYQTLLPAFNSRYVISDCNDPNDPETACSGPGPGVGVIGGTPNAFTALGPSPQNLGTNYGTPCQRYFERGFNRYECQYTTLPLQTRQLVWSPVASTCNYKPGNSNTIWAFGCSIGANTAESVGSDSGGWKFQTYTGDFAIGASVSQPRGTARGLGTRRASIALHADARLPRGLNLRKARIVYDRLLHEPGGLAELVRPAKGRRLTPIALRRVGRVRRGVAVFRSKSRRGRPKVRLVLRKRQGRSAPSLSLRVSGARAPVAPSACNALPAALRRGPDPVTLHTRLRIAARRGPSKVIELAPRWRCRRDRKGNIRRLTVVRPRPLALPGGLRLTARGPRSVRAGGTARFKIVARNAHPAFGTRLIVEPGRFRRVARRPRKATLRAGRVHLRLGRLARGKRRVLKVALVAPRARKGRRVCGFAQVTAVAARPATVRLCASVRR